MNYQSHKTIIIGLLAIFVVVGGYLVVTNPSPEDLTYYKTETAYIADVDDEVSRLEADLLRLDADIKAEAVTPDQAVATKAQIKTRIETIQTAAQVHTGATLTPAMRAVLSSALDRLTVILTTYRDSLLRVETLASAQVVTAAVMEENTKRGRNNSTNQEPSLIELLTETTIVLTIIADPEFVGGEEPVVIIEEATEVNTEAETEYEGEAAASTESETAPEAATSTNLLPEPETEPEPSVGVVVPEELYPIDPFYPAPEEELSATSTNDELQSN
jgi:hypothetical protein